MNNEQKTLMKMLRVNTEFKCGKKTNEETLKAFIFFIEEFERIESQ